MKPYMNPLSARRQSGAALIVSLILLLIMTLIGVTAMRGTILEERMAGGMQDQNRAFQAAEAALRVGEDELQGAVVPTFNNSNGRYAYNHPSRPDWLRNPPAEGNGATAVTLEFPESSEVTPRPPEYFIERLPPSQIPGGSLEAGTPVDDGELFKITARGFGGNESTVVILETYFRR